MERKHCFFSGLAGLPNHPLSGSSMSSGLASSSVSDDKKKHPYTFRDPLSALFHLGFDNKQHCLDDNDDSNMPVSDNYNEVSLKHKERILESVDKTMYSIIRMLDDVDRYNKFCDRHSSGFATARIASRDTDILLDDEGYMAKVQDLIRFRNYLTSKKWEI